MQDQRTEAEKRAEKISTSLIVRRNTAREPVWSAVWRDSGKRSMMRTVGKAWLQERPPRKNPFVEDDDGREIKDESPTQSRWRVDWEKRPGRPKQAMLDERRAMAAARDLVVDRELELLREQRAQSGAPSRFGQLADLWLEEREAEVQDGALKGSTYRDYASMLARPDAVMRKRGKGRTGHLMAAFEHARIEAIGADDLERFQRTLRSRGLSPATRKKYATVTRMTLDFAVSRGWLTQNPMTLQGRQKARRSREKQIAVYMMDQVEQIAQQADRLKGKRKRHTLAEKQVGDAIRLSALTGLRQGELLALRWGDVRWTARTLTIARTHVANVDEDDVPKSNRLRTIPLADQAAVVLDRLSKREKHTRKSDLIFCTEKGSHLDASWLRRRYVKARNLMLAASEDDLPVARWHDLRHTFGTRLAADGLPLSDVKALMGHADLQTTMIYVHHMPQHDLADRLTAAFSDGTPQEALATVTGD